MTDHPLLCDSDACITVDWMRQALAAGGEFEALALDDIEVERLGAATNAFGNLFRCRLIASDESPDLPESVIVKLPVSGRMGFRVARWLSLHQREHYFYQTVAPHAGVRAPKLYFGDFDDNDHRIVLVIEDLRELESVSELEGLSAERARLAIREIAQLHGRFWNAANQPLLADSFNTLSSGFGRFMQTAYLLCLGPALDRFAELFSPETRQIAERLATSLVAHYEQVAAGPMTLTHGDYRGQNLFFGDDSGEIALIDWQGCGIGSGLYDLAYLMGASVPTEVRRTIEREALEEYYAIVSSLGASDYTFADCWRGYRENMLNALVPIILAGGLLDMSDSEQRALAQLGLRRVLTAIEDLNAGELLPERDRSSLFSTLSLCAYQTVKMARGLRRVIAR